MESMGDKHEELRDEAYALLKRYLFSDNEKAPITDVEELIKVVVEKNSGEFRDAMVEELTFLLDHDAETKAQPYSGISTGETVDVFDYLEKVGEERLEKIRNLKGRLEKMMF